MTKPKEQNPKPTAKPKDRKPTSKPKTVPPKKAGLLKTFMNQDDIYIMNMNMNNNTSTQN